MLSRPTPWIKDSEEDLWFEVALRTSGDSTLCRSIPREKNGSQVEPGVCVLTDHGGRFEIQKLFKTSGEPLPEGPRP